MTTQAVLEHLPNNRFRVSGSGRFAVVGEGDTPDEAVEAFVSAARASRVISVEVPDAEPPHSGSANVLSGIGVTDDISPEAWDEFLQVIDQYRAEENSHIAGEADAA